MSILKHGHTIMALETIKKATESRQVCFSTQEYRMIEEVFVATYQELYALNLEIEQLEAMTGDQYVEWQLNQITMRGGK